MNLHLPLAPDVEARLREEATAAGQDLGTYVAHVLTDRLGEAAADQLPPQLTKTAERLAYLEAIAARHPANSHPADARRDTIYGDRGR